MLGLTMLALVALFTLFAAAARMLAEPWAGFLTAAAVALAIGLPLRRVPRPELEPTRRESLVTVLLIWAVVPVLGAIPFAVAGPLGLVEAVFESASGFTTTGATMLTDFEAVSRTLFLWRGLTQWIGGIGIIVLFVAMFPQLAIAGRQLFMAEAPGPEHERLLPRLRTTAVAILMVYGGLTLACTFAYRLGGMSDFDAVANALTTLSAGGFSPAARSFEDYGPALDWIAIAFMTFAGANFSLMYRAVMGRPHALLRDPEFRTYAAVLALGALSLSVLLTHQYGWGEEAFRHGFFQAFSITTSTGYASADFALWSPGAHGLLVVMMLIGGSAGSAAGGVKVVRWLILAKVTTREVRHMLHPRAILPVRVGRRIVPDDVIRAVSAFIALYMALLVLTSVALVLLGSDEVTAFSAALATIGNIGPGFAGVGPMVHYADLHVVAKVWLTLMMIAGRLEVVTVFVVFTRGWWRLPARRERV